MNMTNYTATLRGNDIGRAMEIKITGTIMEAKAAANDAFADGFHGHEIVIHEAGRIAEVSCRTIGYGGWIDVNY
jgi:hypothetical protein